MNHLKCATENCHRSYYAHCKTCRAPLCGTCHQQHYLRGCSGDTPKDRLHLYVRWRSIPTFASELCGLELEPFHLEWLTATETSRNIFIEAPAGHAKTMTMMYAYLLHRVLYNPAERILVASSTMDLARAIVARLRRKLESEDVVRVFGEQRDPERWTNSELRVIKAPMQQKEDTFRAAGKGSNIEGFRYSLGAFDDLVDIEDETSEVERLNTIFWFTHTFLDRAEPGAPRLGIGTPRAPADLNAWIKDQSLTHPGSWKVLEYSAELHPGVDQAVLWPKRWPWEALQAERETMGEQGYARAYLCKPTSITGAVFDPAWLQYENIVDVAEPQLTVLGVDPASTRQEVERGDFMAMASVTADKNGDWHVLLYHARLKFPQQMEAVAVMYRDCRVSHANIESNNAQVWLTQGLAAKYPNMRVVPVDNVGDKVRRITQGLTPLFKTKRIIIQKNQYVDDFVREYTNFPNSRHDDMLDALELALREAQNAIAGPVAVNVGQAARPETLLPETGGPGLW